MKKQKIVGRAGLKASSGPNLKFVITGVLLVAVVGGSMVFRSFAGTARYSHSGNIPTRHTQKTQYSPVVSSKDGWLCVVTTLSDNLPGVDVSYSMHVEKYLGAEKGYAEIRHSKSFSANGNRDRVCFDDGINNNIGYRIAFKSRWPDYKGSYWVYGYYHN